MTVRAIALTTPNNQPNGTMTTELSRLDRIEVILERVAVQQETTATTLDNLTGKVDDITYKVDDFINTATSVLGRSAILDDIIVRLDRNFELHQQRFEENQRSINAALERLEAILMQLMDK